MIGNRSAYENLDKQELLVILKQRIHQRNEALKLAIIMIGDENEAVKRYGQKLYYALKSSPEDGKIEE